MTTLPLPVERFQRMFALLHPDERMPLDDVYAPGIVFEDPLHRLEGIDALRRYFGRLNAGLIEGRFAFEEPLHGTDAAMLPWTMRLTLRHIKQPLVVPGCSHLRFGTRITHQRDYFDAGALVYEHVPLLGSVIRQIKARIS